MIYFSTFLIISVAASADAQFIRVAESLCTDEEFEDKPYNIDDDCTRKVERDIPVLGGKVSVRFFNNILNDDFASNPCQNVDKDIECYFGGLKHCEKVKAKEAIYKGAMASQVIPFASMELLRLKVPETGALLATCAAVNASTIARRYQGVGDKSACSFAAYLEMLGELHMNGCQLNWLSVEHKTYEDMSKEEACEKMDEIVENCITDKFRKCHADKLDRYSLVYKMGASVATKGLVEMMRKTNETFDFVKHC